MSKSYQELEALVISWASQKGILEHGYPIAQLEKTFEECEELEEALEAQAMGLSKFTNSKDKIVNTKEETIDALGDILVTIIIQAEMQGLKLTECLESAYNVIAKRKGKMINGTFVKEE